MIWVLRCMLLMILIVCYSSLYGTTAEESARNAAVYVEAHQYSKAIEIYRSLLDEQLLPWQRNFVLYNIGVALIEQQRWEEALKVFDQIKVDKDSSPLFLRRYYYNLAIALLGYAKSQEGLFSVEDPSFLDRFKKLQILLYRAEEALRATDEAECLLVTLEGEGACETPVDTNLARQRLKEQQAALDNQEREYQAEQLSSGMKAARLLVALKEEEEWLARAVLFPEGNELLPFDRHKLEWMEPFWNSLGAEELSDEQHELERMAYNSYQQALATLEKGDASQARRQLRDSSYWLRAFLEVNAGEEMDALLKVRALSELLGEPSEAFNVFTQKWLQQQMIGLHAHAPALTTLLKKSWDDPQRSLTLYRLATGDIGAVIADVMEYPKAQEQLQLISRAIALSGPQSKLLQDALHASPELLPTALQSLAAALDPKGFLRERLIQITVRYQIALAHRLLNPKIFFDLTTVLEQLRHFIELPEAAKMAVPILSQTLGAAMTNHTSGVEALKAQQMAVARIFFDEARYWLIETRRRTVDVPVHSPERLLAFAVEEQRHAMELVAAVMELPEEQRSPSSPYAKRLHEAMRQAQKQTDLWAAPFVTTVLRHQREAYQATGTDDRTCQLYPWEEVLPLYFLGETASDRAERNLAQALTSLSAVLNDQKVAYRKWLKALELLREGKNRGVAKPKEPSKAQGQQVPSTPTLNPSIEDTLRLLQQMNRDDRNVRPNPPATQTGGEKPW